MPVTKGELQQGLASLRAQYNESVKEINEEFQGTRDWLQDIYLGLKSGKVACTGPLVPKTPSARGSARGGARGSARGSARGGARKGRNLSGIFNDTTISIIHSTINENSVDDSVLSSVHSSSNHSKLKSDVSSSLSESSTSSRKREQGFDESVPKCIRLDETHASEGNSSFHHPTPSVSKSTVKKAKGNRKAALETMSETICLNESSKQSLLGDQTYVNEMRDSCAPVVSEVNGTFVVKSEAITNETFVVDEPKTNASLNETQIQANSTFVKEKSSLSSETKDSQSGTKKKKPEPLHLKEYPSTSGNASLYPVVVMNKLPVSSPVLFSPEAGHPVKKRVKAFEMMNSEDAEPVDSGSTRITRTKSRKQAKDAALKAEKSPAEMDSAEKDTRKPCKTSGASATVRVARKSIARAKKIVAAKQRDSISKSNENLPETLPSVCKKTTVKHYRSESQGHNSNVATVLKSGLQRHKTFTQSSYLGFANKRCMTPLSVAKIMTQNTIGKSATNENHKSKIVTGVESLLSKPAVPLQNQVHDRDDQLQKFAAQALEASKRRDEMIKKQTEEKARKRQEKRERVLSTRDEHERERAFHLLAQKREKEEKARLMQAEKEEKLREKKRLAQQKVHEFEERRKHEEAIRKQQQEREAEIQRRQELEEAEKRRHEKLAQERAQYLARQEAERLAVAKAKLAHCQSQMPMNPHIQQAPYTMNKTFDMSSYDLTLNPEDRPALPPKSSDDYGLDDVHSDDSSDDESKPKKLVPKWAQGRNRLPLLMAQGEIMNKQMGVFFGSKKTTPDLARIFEDIDQRQLLRRSSAVWKSPPAYLQPKNF